MSADRPSHPQADAPPKCSYCGHDEGIHDFDQGCQHLGSYASFACDCLSFKPPAVPQADAPRICKWSVDVAKLIRSKKTASEDSIEKRLAILDKIDGVFSAYDYAGTDSYQKLLHMEADMLRAKRALAANQLQVEYLHGPEIPEAKRVVANADFGEGWYDYDVVDAEEYDKLRERIVRLEKIAKTQDAK